MTNLVLCHILDVLLEISTSTVPIQYFLYFVNTFNLKQLSYSIKKTYVLNNCLGRQVSPSNQSKNSRTEQFIFYEIS